MGRITYLWDEEVNERNAKNEHDTKENIELPAGIRNGRGCHLCNNLGNRMLIRIVS